MTLDFNKIIMESIEETMDGTTDKEKNLSIQESEEGTENVSKYEYKEDYNPAIGPAISAGLGALTLRNKVRTIGTNSSNINEIDWEDIGDKVKNVAATGLKVAKKIGGKVVDKAANVGGKIAEKADYIGLAKIAGGVASGAAGATAVAAGTALANKMRRKKLGETTV